jgi:hypothetical protein
MAIQRYLEWRKYRIQEGDGKESLLTFAQWLGQSQIQVLPPEWEKDLGERCFLLDVPRARVFR